MKTGFLSDFFGKDEILKNTGEQDGLAYSNTTVADLINKDTDQDGIPDWQESLYGLDPTKKETTPGIPDGTAISKLRVEQKTNTGTTSGGNASVGAEPEKLTETEKFSRELFATVAAGTQNGVMDQATIEALGASLTDRLQNTSPRKVFSIFDIKTVNDNSVQAFKNYSDALNNILKTYTINYTVLDVLQKFAVDENTVDVSILAKLDPIITQTNKIISGMVKISVPQSISALHLNVLNSLERLAENLSDIRLYESDPILSLGGISKYQENATALESDVNNLVNAINQKLSN